MVNAPEVSGGAGFTFADRAAAVYLCALLGRQQAPGLPERRVVRVALEQANFGEPLDDLIVDGISRDGSTARLSLQVKRELTVSAAVSNTDFREIVWCAAKTLRKPNFREGVDRVGAATGTIAAGSKRALMEVCEIARESTSELRFFQRFEADGGAGEARRGVVNAFRTMLAESPSEVAGDDVVYRLLRHFVVIEFDSMHEGATADPLAIAWLRTVLDLEDASRAGDLWNRLLVIAREGAGRSADFDSAGLVLRLRGAFRFRRFSTPGQLLQTAAAVPGTADPDIAEVVSCARTAAAADLAAFKRAPAWPLHSIALRLSIKGHPKGRVLIIEDLLRDAEARRELCIVSPPGTGKTTTLVQLTDALLASSDEIAIFVPLNEWSTGNLDIIDSVLGRLAFRTLRLDHLRRKIIGTGSPKSSRSQLSRRNLVNAECRVLIRSSAPERSGRCGGTGDGHT
jgi:hypothetical protein